MKQDKFLSLLKCLLIKSVSILWPLWWTVLPFLIFYVSQNAAFIPISSLIF